MFSRKKPSSNSSSIRKQKLKNGKENQVQYFNRSKSVDLESKRDRNRPILSTRQIPIHSVTESLEDISFHSRSKTNKQKTILTDLFVAASIGDTPQVDYFLRVEELSVDAADQRGWRPLHHAALHGQSKVVELLIRRGANVNCKTVSGLSPILLAGSCLTPRYETINLLLSHGADPNVCSPNGTTPLMDICGREYEPETEKLCSLLLIHNADAEAVDSKQRDVIAYANSVGNIDCIKIIKNYLRQNQKERRKSTSKQTYA